MFFLATAMIAVWVLVTGYILYISQRQRQLEGEIRTLEEMAAARSRGKR